MLLSNTIWLLFVNIVLYFRFFYFHSLFASFIIGAKLHCVQKVLLTCHLLHVASSLLLL